MAFGESWLISVMMRFTSNGARVLNEMATAAQTAETRVHRVTAAMTRLQHRLERHSPKRTCSPGTRVFFGPRLHEFGGAQPRESNARSSPDLAECAQSYRSSRTPDL